MKPFALRKSKRREPDLLHSANHTFNRKKLPGMPASADNVKLPWPFVTTGRLVSATQEAAARLVETCSS